VQALGTEPVSVDGEWEAGLSASGTSGVQFAEVEVDIETGITASSASCACRTAAWSSTS
jgi:hypothetical protein